MKQSRNWLVLGLLAFGIVMRILPYVLVRFGLVSLTDIQTYAWNVSPIPAMCLLGGAYVTSKWLGFGVGFAVYLLCDLLIGFISGQPSFAFYKSLPFVYAGIILYGVIGLTLSGSKSPGRIVVAALSAEIVFFLISNFGEWAVGDSNYPKSFAGLLECYAAAIPFMKNSLIGMCVYAPILFGLFAVVESRIASEQPQDGELQLARARN